MLFKSIISFVALALTALASDDTELSRRQDADASVVNWGIMAFPGADILDVYGPIELLYFVAGNLHINVKIITPIADNIVISPPMGNRFNSTFRPEIVGAATFDDDLDLDVLMVPGGAAARDPSMTYVDEYLRKTAPKVKHFVTICTGALFAARAGLLEGKRATTNKGAWQLVTAHGDNVTWVAPARWVRDGNTWSSSGVSAGIDLTFAMIKEFYGKDLHDRITVFTEILPRAHDDDPFTDIVGIPHQGQLNETDPAKCRRSE